MKTLSSIVNCKKRIGGFLLVSMLLFGASAQAANTGKIEGTVTDAETYKAIPAARVELLREKDSTVMASILTDLNGKYAINNIAFGRYVLRISGMSYQKQTIPDVEVSTIKPNVTFGTTNLIPSSTMLKEASVTAYKLTGQMEDDKTTYSIKEKSAAIAQSGLDLLRQLPDITVDYRTNAVTMAGSNNILFQVNGKKVDQSYLQQLNPKLIDKVEVITNPGVKYDADVDAVVNIILKKDMQGGVSGRISLETPTSSKNFFYNENASVDYYIKKFRFFVSGYYGGNKWDIRNTIDRKNITDNNVTSEITQDQNGKSNYRWGGFNYGADWFISDNDMVNFYSSVKPSISNTDEMNSNNSLRSAATTFSQTRSNNGSKDWNNNYSLYYKHKFAKKDQELALESYFGSTNSENTNNYKEWTSDEEFKDTTTLTNKSYQETTNRRHQFVFKADYTHPITDKLKASVGYNLNLNRIFNTYSEFVTNAGDEINYDEDRQCVYGNIAWNVNKFNLQTGLRYELSNISISHSDKTKSDYSSFLPFASVQYKLGQKQTLRLNFRRSVQRPSMSQLSPFNVKQDNYTVSKGNVDLSPAYINKFEFTHRIQLMEPMFVSYRPYVSFITDGIRQVNFQNGDILTQVYKNVSSEFEYGITLSGSLAFAKWWSLTPSYTYYKRDIKALPEYDIEASKRTSWRMNLSSQFILPKEWVIFVQYEYNAPEINHQTRTERNYEFVTGFYKAINKKFSMTAYVLNPWSNKFTFEKTSVNSNSIIQNQNGWISYKYIANIQLTYSFRSGKEGKKVERQNDSENEPEKKKSLF